MINKLGNIHEVHFVLKHMYFNLSKIIERFRDISNLLNNILYILSVNAQFKKDIWILPLVLDISICIVWFK